MADETEIPYDEERVYDEQIDPLMKQIFDICKQHGIPMIASFAYANDGTPSLVSTAVADDLVGTRWPATFERMYVTLFGIRTPRPPERIRPSPDVGRQRDR